MGATPSGTRDYFDLQRQGPGQISPVILGRTGWSVSPVGFGAYRTVFEQHEEALRTALLSGFNLIDTSPSYGNGSSEQLIGKVISSLISEGALTREQIILVTKVPLGPQTSINDRLTRSLERLRTDSIDVLLLENPEYFLKNGGTHAEYYQLLRTAFEDLESEVRRGRIQYYGISSNTLPEPKNHDTFTSLEFVWENAQSLGSNHHLGVIEFPLNLLEPGAAVEANNNTLTLLEFARARDLGTLVNRPLNALRGRALFRLADRADGHGGAFEKNELENALSDTLQLEANYPGEEAISAGQIAWAHMLRKNLDQLVSIESWEHILASRIRPILSPALERLAASPEFAFWADEYRFRSEELFSAVSRFLEKQHANRSETISRLLVEAAPELESSQSLSNKAIRVYRSLAGVHCVLVGLRQVSHVREALELKPPISAESALHALRAVQES
ncbi:MAG TPA: aldo/keto reductase [Bdellovibrionota bacterium]|nr:aldo/keto reductase [Bdellovibrionota bacterium]